MSPPLVDRRTRVLRHADYLDRQGRRELAEALRAVVRGLLDVGTECRSFTGSWTCADPGSGRTKGAQYGADAWCDGCIAREALDGTGG